MMAAKCQDIPFLIDGVVKIVKSVTKQTTCADVISKLPNLQCPLAVFQSVNGVEKELADKTKLLKVWRAHGPSSRVVFIVKKSETTVTKRKKSALPGELKKVNKSTSKRRTTKEGLKKVADLAFYVRYQKTKVENMKRKIDELSTSDDESSLDVRSSKLRSTSSTSSMDSMDAFLANKADLEKMSKFLSFCGGVTDEHLGISRKVPKASRDQDVHEAERAREHEASTREGSVKQMSKNIIHTSLKNMRLGFKQRFSSKSTTNTTKQTTSTGTISSTESGYQSASTQIEGQCPAGLPKKHTFLAADLEGVPRHSTPVTARSAPKVARVVAEEEEEQDLFDITTFDELAGKDAILRKFMADQDMMTREMDSRASIGCYGFAPECDVSREAACSRFSLPAFNSQKEKCRFLWDKYCDSDSESEADDSDVWCQPSKADNSSQLDNAFIDSIHDVTEVDFVTPKNRTLRRESAISNLAKFSLRPININLDDDDSFDYSFDCTFPRMDETQSVEFPGCLGDEDFSQMKQGQDFTFDVESDVDVTTELLKDMCDDSEAESDEGLGSMSSGSVQSIIYL